MRHAIAAALAVGLVASAPAVAQEIDEREFNVVGTWGNLLNWRDHESRLWNEVLPEASGGRITANAKPYTELGLSGFEVMRLLKLGTYDAVHALTSYVSQDSPPLEGIDLAGVIQDFETYREAMEAYEPVIRRELRETYNAELIMIYSFPSQQLWCKLDTQDVSLATLQGKKIRGYSTTHSDLIEGLGAAPVTIAFAEVVPSLEKGVVDCGITGTGPAYNAKWWQVANTNIQVRIGYAATFLAINLDTWESLSPATQELIREQAQKVEDQIWQSIIEVEEIALRCNADGPCPWGEPGGMMPVAPSPEDQARLKEVVENVVLKRFVDRCGEACAREWNETVGKVAGVKAPL